MRSNTSRVGGREGGERDREEEEKMVQYTT